MDHRLRYTVLLLWVFISPVVLASTLPERVEKFLSLFDYKATIAVYDIRMIQSDYPTQLLTPESMYPQTFKYPLKDIQQLYKLSQTCEGKLPLNSLISEPLVFVRALCKKTPLPIKWFSRSGFIHPGGGSYAARYVNLYPEEFDVLQSFMHIKERPRADASTLIGRLQVMSSDAIIALLSGADMFIEKEQLWLRRGEKYYLFDPIVWKKHAQNVGLTYSLRSDTANCFVQRGNICWNTLDHSRLWQLSMIVLIILNLVLMISWSIYRWNTKRRELKSKMLILQILTHELRTPIASLSLTVEGFRREFERLPESVYDEFRRLCEDSRRLRQLAEASKDYLQSDTQALSTEWLPSVQEWLEYKKEALSYDVTLLIKQDVSAKLNIYWLGTCLDNLLKNAHKYGVAPINIEVEIKSNGLIFKICDQGNLSQKDWKHLKKPFVSKNGLGLGLTIVESMIGRMGGKMTLQGPPTTFILEIPCETDIVTR